MEPTIPNSGTVSVPQSRTWGESLSTAGSWLATPVTAPVSWLRGTASAATAATSASAAMPGQINKTLEGATELTGQLTQTADTADKFMVHTAQQLASANSAVQRTLDSTVPVIRRDIHVVSNATAGVADEAKETLRIVNQGMSTAGRVLNTVAYFGRPGMGVAAGIAACSVAEKYIPEGNVRLVVKGAGGLLSAYTGIKLAYRIWNAVLSGRTSKPVAPSEPAKPPTLLTLDLDGKKAGDADIAALKGLLGNEYSSISQYFEMTVFNQIQEYNAKLASSSCPPADRPALNRKLRLLAENAFEFFRDAPITNTAEYSDATRLRQDFIAQLAILKISPEMHKKFSNEGLPSADQLFSRSDSAAPVLSIAASETSTTPPASSASDSSTAATVPTITDLS